jgi:hypothetical protein
MQGLKSGILKVPWRDFKRIAGLNGGFLDSFSLLLLCFFITFSLPSTLTPHYEQLAH